MGNNVIALTPSKHIQHYRDINMRKESTYGLYCAYRHDDGVTEFIYTNVTSVTTDLDVFGDFIYLGAVKESDDLDVLSLPPHRHVAHYEEENEV